MSVTTPLQKKVAEPRPPTCPYCKQMMQIIALYPYQIGNLIIPTVQCPHCGVFLGMQFILPQAVPAEPGESPKSPLWKPS